MSRIALVTGGTRGIGKAISRHLHGQGYRVIANYGGDDQAAADFSGETGIPSLRFDVSDFDRTRTAVASIEEEWGPIDILVNNAGITRDSMFHKMDTDAWSSVLQTNLTSCFNTCRAVIGGMRERKFGRIVNVSSMNGQAGQLGQANYAAAKAGMIGFSKSLALETAGKGITVNVVAPGYIDTEMCRTVPEPVLEKVIAKIPVGRLGEVDEVARAVAYLVGEDGGFITGSTLSINGGQLML